MPDDIEALKFLVADQAVRLDQFVARNEELQADKQAAEQKNERLTARVRTLTEQSITISDSSHT